MFVWAYCVDGPDALRLRETEFARHGVHIKEIAPLMTFGAPLTTRDSDVVAGDPNIVSSLICVEAADVAAAEKILGADPYFQCGAWSAIDLYTGAPRRAGADFRGNAASGKFYLALAKNVPAEARLEALAGQLDGVLACGTLSYERRIFAPPAPSDGFEALCIFHAPDMAKARAQFAAAARETGCGASWEILSIPRISGTWAGVSPMDVVSEHQNRG